MKHVIAALLGATALVTPVMASDIYTKGSLKDVDQVEVSTGRWQGPYVGIGVGYQWQRWNQDGYTIPGKSGSKSKCSVTSPFAPDATTIFDGLSQSDCAKLDTQYSDSKFTAKIDPIKPVDVAAVEEDQDGWLLTGRFGYDWQRGSFVFGPVFEGNWLNPGNTKHFDEAEFSGSALFRAGFLINSRILAYAIGGVEVTDYEHISASVNPTLGGGLELLIGDGWSLLGEGRYTFAENEDLPSGISKDDPVSVRALLVKKF